MTSGHLLAIELRHLYLSHSRERWGSVLTKADPVITEAEQRPVETLQHRHGDVWSTTTSSNRLTGQTASFPWPRRGYWIRAWTRPIDGTRLDRIPHPPRVQRLVGRSRSHSSGKLPSRFRKRGFSAPNFQDVDTEG